jgi:hypothetical protein
MERIGTYVQKINGDIEIVTTVDLHDIRRERALDQIKILIARVKRKKVKLGDIVSAWKKAGLPEALKDMTIEDLRIAYKELKALERTVDEAKRIARDKARAAQKAKLKAARKPKAAS